MQLQATFVDGETAHKRNVTAQLAGEPANGVWTIADAETRQTLAQWPATSLFATVASPERLVVASRLRSQPQRLTLFGSMATKARPLMPQLARNRRQKNIKTLTVLTASTAVLAATLFAYVSWFPVAARLIADRVPPAWETQLGAATERQVRDLLGSEYGYSVCDADPQSPANQAISRFVAAVTEGVDMPVEPRVTLVRSTMPNAFALPGGQIYVFSALIDEAQSSDEFAGVVAHEIGHVVHRHSLQQIIASSGTGLIVGFMLGDMTGMSAAAGLGAAVLDSRNSRTAEHEADEFAGRAAKRVGFDPTALAAILDRISKDDTLSATLSLISSHPLTSERRAELAAYQSQGTAQPEAFSQDEWRAIAQLCAPDKSRLETQPKAPPINDTND